MTTVSKATLIEGRWTWPLRPWPKKREARPPRPSFRPMVRDLLQPGIYQAGGDRGLHFTDDEASLVIDACIAAGGVTKDALGHYPGITAAKQVMDELIRLPLTLHLRQRHLSRLRSVSLAYKLSVLPPHFRFKTLERYVR